MLSLWETYCVLYLYPFSIRCYSEHWHHSADQPQFPGVHLFAQRHCSGLKTHLRLLQPFDVNSWGKYKQHLIFSAVFVKTVGLVRPYELERLLHQVDPFILTCVRKCITVWKCVLVCVDIEDRFIRFSHVNCTPLTQQLGTNVWNERCVHSLLGLWVCLFFDLLLCVTLCVTKWKCLC